MEGITLNERQEHILKQLRDVGHVEVESLARQFEITTQTVRRDLSELCERGLAVRVHGGAKRRMSTSVIAYEQRRLSHMEDKQAIAVAAAGLIPNDATLAINIGTTTEQVAESLKLHRGLTVVSNNINVVHILREARLRSLILIGGEVRLSDGAIVGTEAVDAISNYKVDFAIIGASSLDADGSILDFDQREVAAAKALLANARMRILVCDASKFEVSAPFRICDIGQLDYFVTNAPPPPSFVQMAEENGTTVIVTGGE